VQPRETDSSRSATRTLPPVAQHAWYAVWVRSHFEQDVREQLSAKGFHTFLPELPSWSRRADGRLTFPTPMFPGYLFVREALDKSRYIDLLSVHGVVRILEDGWLRLTPIPDAEIDALQRIVAADVPVHPCAHLRDGMRVRVLDGPLAGIEGKGVYRRLKYESGVHRVQRVPVTEASGRIHTSTATVAVLPEAEEVDIQIDANDLRIDTFCASGPGGQSVNTTKSAVRITHIPTGLVVSQQDEKSQVKNRQKAMRVLRSRLYEMEMRKQQEAIATERRGQVGSGERSEKIRTYNFKENRITDHRINFTMHQLAGALDGDIQVLIDQLEERAQSDKLTQATKVESVDDSDDE